MAKIAFIGKEPTLRGFNYFGTTVFRVSTPQEAEAQLQALVADQENTWGIIYLEEVLAEPILPRVVQLNKGVLPVISIFPSIGEKKELSKTMLHHLVRKVTGVEMRFD